jgi:hypothetical protein
MKIASSGWQMHGGGDLRDLAPSVRLGAKVLGSETRQAPDSVRRQEQYVQFAASRVGDCQVHLVMASATRASC